MSPDLMKVHLQGDTWHVSCYDFTGAPDRDTIDIMGTYVIPTGFRAAMSFEDVQAELRRLNPGTWIVQRD